jgi:DNA topoisomerase-2
MKEALQIGLYTKFKLVSKISISNMMLFGADGAIKKYDGPEDIVHDFFTARLDLYKKRREYLLRVAEAELRRMSNKARFILSVVDGDLVLNNRKRADIEEELEQKGFDKLTNQKKSISASDEASEGENDGAKSYEYLLGMSLSSLTLEKVEALKRQEDECKKEVEILTNTTEAQMWRDDLEAFLEAYTEYEKEEAKRDLLLSRQQARARRAETKRSKASKGKKKGKKKANDWSDESDFSGKFPRKLLMVNQIDLNCVY